MRALPTSHITEARSQNEKKELEKEKQPALHKESRTEWDFRRRHKFVLVVSYLIEGSSLWP